MGSSSRQSLCVLLFEGWLDIQDLIGFWPGEIQGLSMLRCPVAMANNQSWTNPIILSLTICWKPQAGLTEAVSYWVLRVGLGGQVLLEARE